MKTNRILHRRGAIAGSLKNPGFDWFAAGETNGSEDFLDYTLYPCEFHIGSFFSVAEALFGRHNTPNKDRPAQRNWVLWEPVYTQMSSAMVMKKMAKNVTGGKEMLVVASKVMGWRWDGKDRSMLAGVLSGKIPTFLSIPQLAPGNLSLCKEISASRDRTIF
jgi:hypothetical protein